MDYAGPFDIKNYTGRAWLITKGYVLVFVVFFTKAIRLDPTSEEHPIWEAYGKLVSRASRPCFTSPPLHGSTPLKSCTPPSDNLPSNEWQLERIESVIPGADGNVRVVVIRTARGIVNRPVTKVVLLPREPSNTTS